jgi:uncharacterized damage-inducible protein DinB
MSHDAYLAPISCCATAVSHGSVKGMNNDLRYPIGKFSSPSSLSSQERADAVQSIAELPQKLRAAVHGLAETQIDTPYREGGWTVRQTVHHVADSHMQGFSRVRKSLTEEWPAVMPYKQNLWAELADARTQPVEVSLQLLNALHTRWIILLQSLTESDWTAHGYIHPAMGKQSFEQLVALYVWHGRHHTAQITGLRERMEW